MRDDGRLNVVDWIALVLTIVGALDWGLVGLFRFNLVEALFGGTFVAPLVYILVGLAGLWLIYLRRHPYRSDRVLPESGGAPRFPSGVHRGTGRLDPSARL